MLEPFSGIQGCSSKMREKVGIGNCQIVDSFNPGPSSCATRKYLHRPLHLLARRVSFPCWHSFWSQPHSPAALPISDNAIFLINLKIIGKWEAISEAEQGSLCVYVFVCVGIDLNSI